VTRLSPLRPRRRPARRRHRARTTAVAAAALSAVLLAAGCGAGTTSAGSVSASGAPRSGGTLDLAFWPDNAAFACVDPFQTYWIEHRTVIRNFADSLTDQDPTTGKIVPWLATSWKVAGSGKSYTFTLRDGVTFSDGTPLDAAAVKTSFDGDAALLKELPTAYGGVYIAGYAGTDVLDDHTVRVRFSTPNAAFLQATSTTNLAILAPSSYTKTPEERCLGQVVGSGPFTLDSYRPTDGIDLSRRPGYTWGSSLNAHTGDAYLDHIKVSYVAEDSVRVGNLTSGAVDVAWPRNPFGPEQVAQLEGSGDTVQSRPLPGPSSALYPNTAPGRPLADVAVRRAVQKGIDRATYAKTIYGDDYPVVQGPYDTTTPYAASQAGALAYDPDGAKSLLDAAGWTPGADGIRVKDGRRLTLVDAITAETPGDVLLQDQLKQIGIEVQLKVSTVAERPNVITAGAYDLIGTYYTRADPGVLQWILDPAISGSKALAQNSQTPAEAAKVKALFTAGIVETDAAKRAKVYAQLQQYLVAQGISLPVFERVQQAGFSPKVHGFRYTSESFGSFYDVWLDS
jgi:peptide/nickel transport system substrate-binding protein